MGQGVQGADPDDDHPGYDGLPVHADIEQHQAVGDHPQQHGAQQGAQHGALPAGQAGGQLVSADGLQAVAENGGEQDVHAQGYDEQHEHRGHRYRTEVAIAEPDDELGVYGDGVAA